MSSSSTTSVHVTALDGLVNVNSLFTIAVFVGLSLATPGPHQSEGIRLGMLSYGSKSAVHAVAALVVLVTTALLVYISTAVYGFLH
ncbi:hypothetical protein ACFX15_034695 [Malus domestica]